MSLSHSKTAAQEEFDTIVSKASASEKTPYHPSDAEDYRHDRDHDDKEEQDEYNNQQIDDAMRMPSFSSSGPIKLPHRDFDNGRTTGVKGVIADARSYETARRNGGRKNKNTLSPSRAQENKRASTISFLKDDGEGSESEDEEFLERWREMRKRELEREGNDIRTRRTSPSVRRYGRFDEVDALGYLDAIEKVTRETVVVVFVYDADVSSFPLSNLSYPVLSIIRSLTNISIFTVRSIPNRLPSPQTPRRCIPLHPLRPCPLPRHRVRQRRHPRHPRVQEPG